MGRIAALVGVAVLAIVVGNVGQSFAGTAGTELLEPAVAEAVGEDAYVTVASTTAFPAEGGDAVFEPGTESEEHFHYAAVDEASHRLVGLTRPSPIAHPAGAFVQAPAATVASEPSSEPAAGEDQTGESSDASAEPPSGETSQDGSSIPSSSEGATSIPSVGGAPDSSTATDSVDTNIVDVVVAGVQEILAEAADPCGMLDIDCGVELRDPCDPNSTGQTCDDFLRDQLAPLVGDSPCSGRTAPPECVSELLDKIKPANCTATIDGTPTMVCCNGYGLMIMRSFGTYECEREQVWMNIHLTLDPPGGERPIPLSPLPRQRSRYNDDFVSHTANWTCMPGFWRVAAHGTASHGTSDSDYSDYFFMSPFDCKP